MWIEMPHMQCLICICAWSMALLALANTFPRLERTKSSYGNRVTTFYNLFSFSSFFREFFFLSFYLLFSVYLSFLFSISISSFPSFCLSLLLHLFPCVCICQTASRRLLFLLLRNFVIRANEFLTGVRPFNLLFFSFFFARLICWWFYFVFIRWMSY